MSTAEVSNILMYLEPVRVDVGAPLLPPPAGELHDKAFGWFSSRLQQGGLRDPWSKVADPGGLYPDPILENNPDPGAT